jgi:hypothetical protein
MVEGLADRTGTMKTAGHQHEAFGPGFVDAFQKAEVAANESPDVTPPLQ